MNKKRIFAFLAAVLLLLLTACKSDQPGGETPAVEQIAADALPDYQIVVPVTMSSEERTALTQLTKSVYASFGVLLTVVNDDLTQPGEKEILIGETDRAESAEAKKTLKYDDYFIGIMNGKLVVRGGSASATAAALLKLKDSVAANRGDASFFRSDRDALTYRRPYRFADMKINGISVSEYTILYADARQNREQTFAELLQKEIISLCGVEVPVQSDAKAAYGNAVYFGGVNPAADSALLSADEDLVYIRGNDRDVFYATQTLLARLNGSADGTITVAGREELSYTNADLDLSAYGVYPEMIKVMSYNLQNAGQNTSESKYRQLAMMIDAGGADIISVQECVTTAAANSIRDNLKRKDSFAVITGIGPHTGVIYNKDLYTMVEKGFEKIGTADDENGSLYDRYNFWVKFRSNESGAEFVVVPIHIDYVETACAAQLQIILDFMKETYPGVPAVMLGDYNMPEEKLKTKYLTDAGFSSAKDTAISSPDRTLATFPSKGDTYVIDFIYYTGMSAQYYEVMNKDFNPSDHRPILANLYID